MSTDSKVFSAHKDPNFPLNIYFVDIHTTYSNLIAWHWHEEIELIIIHSGHARFYVNDTFHELKEGQGMLINQNVLHSVRLIDHQNCQYYSIIFPANFIIGNDNIHFYNHMKLWVIFG